ncbi:hypothetical protein ACQRBK_01805 [Peptoniphilaceae bacterium SGI.137]
MDDNLYIMLFWFLILILPIVLQVMICKKTIGKVGLVLPGIAFFISIIYTLNVANVAEEKPYLTAIMTFLLMNTETLVLYVIYLVYRKRNMKNKEMEKMKLRDL